MSFDVKYDAHGRIISKNPIANLSAEQLAFAENQARIEGDLVENTTTDNLSTVADNMETTQLRQDSEEQVEETTVDNMATVKQVQPQQQETSQAKNFRQLREKSEKIERERDELLRRFREQEQLKAQVPEEDNEIRLAPDDLAEGKHLSKIEKKYQKLEQQFKQYQQQTNNEMIQARIKNQFPDFEKVVSKDNVDLLQIQYPEIAQTLNASTDLYSTAVSAYTMIKKLGIAQEDVYQADRERAQKNMAKPKPSNSIAPQSGTSPLAKANAFAEGLTKEYQAQLLKEMTDSRKNY